MWLRLLRGVVESAEGFDQCELADGLVRMRWVWFTMRWVLVTNMMVQWESLLH